MAALMDLQEQTDMTEEQIDHMVNRFLSWKLPSDFSPDCGITFKQVSSPAPLRSMHWPVGTNLLTYTQAREMVLHMLKNLPEEK